MHNSIQNEEGNAGDNQTGDKTALPKRVVPITSHEDWRQMPAIISAALQEISNDNYWNESRGHNSFTHEHVKSMRCRAGGGLGRNAACTCTTLLL